MIQFKNLTRYRGNPAAVKEAGIEVEQRVFPAILAASAVEEGLSTRLDRFWPDVCRFAPAFQVVCPGFCAGKARVWLLDTTYLG